MDPAISTDRHANATTSKVDEATVTAAATAAAAPLGPDSPAAAETSHSSSSADVTSASEPANSSAASSSSVPAPAGGSSEPETETMTMDDDDFLASLEAYERRGQRSRHSVSDPYIPPPLAAKLARLSGAPPPVVEPPKSPEQKAQESWDKSIGEYKDLKASKGKWRPAKKVWEVPEEALSPLSVSARETPLPASPAAAADNADEAAVLRFSPRTVLPVEDPSVSPEAEEQGWMETRLRLGDALTEPNSALSGFAPLNLRGSANAANLRKASVDEDGQPKAPSSPTSLTVSAEEFESMLLASPVKQARHSEAEHLQLLRAYLADLSAQFYTQSSCGARLVKHSKYGFPKVKVVKLNHETGVLSWGSGEIRIRDLVSMKLHRFSGSTLPSNAATNSITAAAALAKSLSPPSKPAPVEGAAAAPVAAASSSSSSSSSAAPPSPKALKAKASSTAPTASATTPPPAKGHFLFTLTTPARALQLDAPTAFDRELWLLGLYNFHRSFVVDAAAAATAAASSSKSRAAVPFNALHPVRPLQTINFEVMPTTGEMRINLTREAAPASPPAPTAALPQSPPLAGKTASLSPSLASSVALTSEPDFSLNKPWWHPSLMAPPAAAATALSGPGSPAPLLSTSSPSASFLFHVSSGRASLIKHSRSGKPKVCSLTISKAGLVSWKGKETLALCDALDVVSGCLTQVFSKSLKGLKKPPAASACFSILMPARTLDLECYVPDDVKKMQSKRKGSADDANEGAFDEAKQVEMERDAWVTQLKRLIASLQTVNAKTVEENVDLHSNPLASSSPTTAAAVAAAAAANSGNGPSSPPKANGGTASSSPPVAAFTFRPPASPAKGASASAGSVETATATPAVTSAPVVGWRRSIVSDAPLIIHDSDSDLEDDDGAPKPNGRRAAAGADSAGADSSSDSDSDSDSSSDSELADDDRATTAEDRERAYAEARLRLAATAGSKGAPAAVAAVDGHEQEVDGDSDEEALEERNWETWQSDDPIPAAAASTSPDSASAATAGSEASGEDSALASLLRMEPVSAVRVPLTTEQMVSGSTAALVEQLQQRDATIRELQATVRRLTAQNAQLQAQLEANKVDALLLSSVLPQRSHARDKRK